MITVAIFPLDTGLEFIPTIIILPPLLDADFSPFKDLTVIPDEATLVDMVH